MFSELVLCRKLFPIRYCCHRSDHELKVGAHIQAINMSGQDDGIQCSNGLGTILGVAKEPIFASDHKIANQPFNSVIADRHVTAIGGGRRQPMRSQRQRYIK